jgi:Arc/MetJ-type ribon-helix-helix transcriptional regulator
MGVIQVELPDELKSLVDRHVAEGKVASAAAFLVEAARRFAEALAGEAETSGTAGPDWTAVRYVTVSTPKDGHILHERTMALLQDRLAAYRQRAA